jgi:UDPglucose 6-dehydrogenase
MDIPSAELTKYAANAMLATRISFMNQIARLCEVVGADVGLVRRGIGSDPRIGSAFLFPGPGYGGSCFPKDVKALIRTGADLGVPLDVLTAVEAVNARQKLRLLEKLRAALGGTLRGKHVAVWGLSFKAETDDMRESPAVPLIEGLLADGATVTAFDPQAMGTARAIFADRIRYATDPYDALAAADALAVVTEWLVFRNPDFARMKQALRQPVVVDGRNLYEPRKMATLGFRYVGIGRGERA